MNQPTNHRSVRRCAWCDKIFDLLHDGEKYCPACRCSGPEMPEDKKNTAPARRKGRLERSI